MSQAGVASHEREPDLHRRREVDDIGRRPEVAETELLDHLNPPDIRRGPPKQHCFGLLFCAPRRRRQSVPFIIFFFNSTGRELPDVTTFGIIIFNFFARH